MQKDLHPDERKDPRDPRRPDPAPPATGGEDEPRETEPGGKDAWPVRIPVEKPPDAERDEPRRDDATREP